jgi:hypothetical protein
LAMAAEAPASYTVQNKNACKVKMPPWSFTTLAPRKNAKTR